MQSIERYEIQFLLKYYEYYLGHLPEVLIVAAV